MRGSWTYFRLHLPARRDRARYRRHGGGPRHGSSFESLELRHMMDSTGLLAGDVNRDGHFSSEDLVITFEAGKFNTGTAASWDEGDWNQDGYFDSSDLILVSSLEGYESAATQTAPLQITEFLAAGSASLKDADGESSDWIEIRNVSSTKLNTSGWKLTDSSDEMARWELPSVDLEPEAYLIIFASGKDRRDPARELHTNFKLSAGGEYLALVTPDGQIATEFAPAFPAQDDDISYGVRRNGTIGQLARVTPGGENPSAFYEVATVISSNESGYYAYPFTVTLSTTTPDATIRYTLDGSEPSPSHGTIYSDPISIAQTSVLRTAAFIGDAGSDTVTRSFLFADDILSQTDEEALTAGLPATWGSRTADYAMDQTIIGQNGTDNYEGKYSGNASAELRALPVVSLAIDPSAMFGTDGIYSNPTQRGADWERAVSIDYFNAGESATGFQSGAGIRIQGGISRSVSAKLSFRLLFKDEYGASKLNYKLFGDDAADEFNSLTLRASGGDFSQRYINDAFGRATQLATGQAAPHGQWVNLYINGLYWGLYEIVERPDETFASNYFGGDEDNWDVINAGDLGNEQDTAIAGSLDAWQTLVGMARQLELTSDNAEKSAIYQRILGNAPDGTDEASIETLLDVDNYIDYLLINWYIKNTDWPHRNYYMMRQRGEDSTGFKFITWDTELSLSGASNLDLSTFGKIQQLGPSLIYQGLSSTQEFKTRFAERLAIHTSPGGAFSSSQEILADGTVVYHNASADRYRALIEAASVGMALESARWGDSPGGKPGNNPGGNGGPTLKPDSTLGDDIHSNAIGFGSTILSSSQPMTPLISHMDVPGDKDVFSLTPSMDTFWTLTLLPWENSLGVHVEIQDATGTPIAQSDLSATQSFLQSNLLANHTYYLIVSGLDTNATGTYALMSSITRNIPGGGMPGGEVPGGGGNPGGGDPGGGVAPDDGTTTGTPWTRDEVWRVGVEEVAATFFASRLDQLITELKAVGLVS